MTLILKNSFYCIFQLTNDRAIQLQTNTWCERTALGINACHQINDYSQDLQCYNAIEKYDPK